MRLYLEKGIKIEVGGVVHEVHGGQLHPIPHHDWQPIPHTIHPGGQRRRRGADWEYRYPQPGGGWSHTPHTPSKEGAKPEPTPPARPKPKPTQLVLKPKTSAQVREQFGITDRQQAAMEEMAGRPAPFKPTPKLTVEVPAKEEAPTKFETTGYVFGSRAEMWALRNSGELERDPKVAYSVVTKKAVMGGEVRPESFLAERDQGVEPAAAYLKFRLLQSIQSRPPDSPEMRELFSEGIMTLQAGLARCRTAVEVMALIEDWRNNLDGYATPLRLTPEQVHERGYGAIGNRLPAGMPYQDWTRSPEYQAMRDAERKLERDGYSTRTYRPAPDSPMTLYRELDGAAKEKTIQQARAMGKAFVALLDRKIVDVHSLYGGTMAASWRVRGATGDSAQVMRVRAAKLFNVPSWDWAQPAGSKPVGPSTETTRTDKDQYHSILSQARMGDVVRKGPPIPVNKGIGARGVKDDLALHEVEYGHWANEDERQWHTEAAHAAFHDLADILGIDHAQVGLNRRLSLSIGSRGQGKASATYHPATQVINITKMSGKGSLAHEWGHFLDHTIYTSHNPGGGKTIFPSDALFQRPETAGDIPAPILIALNGVMRAIMYEPIGREDAKQDLAQELTVMREAYREMKEGTPEREQGRLDYNAKVMEFNAMLRKRDFRIPTPFHRKAAKMGDYWCRPHELFARSFEAFIQDELKAKERQNTYLVQGTDFMPGYPGYYPGGQHRTRVNDKMRALVGVLKESNQFVKALQQAWSGWLDSLTEGPDLVIKAAALPIGIIRQWRGGQYQKVGPHHWVPVRGATPSPAHEATPFHQKRKAALAKLAGELAKIPAEEKAKMKRAWVKGQDFGLPDQTINVYSRSTEKKDRFGSPVRDYFPHRANLHADLVNRATSRVARQPEGQLHAIVMMGGGGSGKGTIKKALFAGQLDRYVNVDPDEVKEQLPEYQMAIGVRRNEQGQLEPTEGLGQVEGKKVTALDAAYMAHEESSEIATQIMERAIDQKQNLVLDGTGANGAKYASKIEALRQAGYRVTLLYAHIEMDEAIARAKNRAEHGGRYVPLPVLRSGHSSIPHNWEQVSGASDEYAMYFSSDPPKLMWSGTRGGESHVHDKQLVDRFMTYRQQLPRVEKSDQPAGPAQGTSTLPALLAHIGQHVGGVDPEFDYAIPDATGMGGVVEVDPDFVEETRQYLDSLKVEPARGGLVEE